MGNTLYLEKRGCNFFEGTYEKLHSNVGNYRVCTPNLNIEGKNGRTYFLEFTLCHNMGHYRTTNKRTGKPLKYEVYEIDTPCGLGINTQYDEDGLSWRDLKIEKAVYAQKLEYSQENILKVVNDISKTQYDKIVFIA